MSALIVVDVQNDFCEGGSLAVTGGKSVVKAINKLIEGNQFDLIVASQDWHQKSHVSFAQTHGRTPFDKYTLTNNNKQFETTLWPVHCVQNTYGAELVDGLLKSRINYIVQKGQTNEFYSAFADVFNEQKTDLLNILQKHNIKEVTVVGLALDFCVKHTALDAVKYFKTTIDLGCTKGISDQGVQNAKRELQGAGVLFK